MSSRVSQVIDPTLYLRTHPTTHSPFGRATNCANHCDNA